MLVYLDSAQFDGIERATPAARVAFFETWRIARCELALSLHHLQEMGQLSDASSLSRRLDVLREFPVIRCLPASSASVLRSEIRALLENVLLESRVALFRDQFFPLADRAILAAQTLGTQTLFHVMADAIKTSTSAELLSKQARPVAPLKLSKADIDWDELYRDSLTMVAEASGAGSELHQVLLTMFDQTFERIRGHGSARNALVSLFGLSAVEVVRKIPDDDLSSALVFYSTARAEAVALASEHHIDPEPLLSRVNGISMYDCPGFRLKLAAQRGRRTHPKEPEPGDQIDEDHVMFAPYVDLLIGDKRTVGFVSQRTKNPFLQLPEGAVANIKRVADLDECRAVISKFGNRLL
jgi:hypothetical protein